MDFADKIRTLGDKVAKLKDAIQTEEATKTAFIMPFIVALDYDIFNPLEVVPEFVADIGIKKGEKIDYCIFKDSKPIILVECKHWRENLNDHDNQLRRYFFATSAKFAILTNGISYRFYTDSEQKNKMDDRPFWEFDITNLSETDITELEKYRKTNFDEGEIFNKAIDLKISNDIIQIMKKELMNPSDDFVKFFAKQIHDGTLTKRIIFQYKGIITKSLNRLLNTPLQDRLHEQIYISPQGTDDYKKKNPIMVEAGKKAAKTRQQTKVYGFAIGDEKFKTNKSKEVLILTAEWLISRGSLTKSNAPISSGSRNYLIHTVPRHQNNTDFRAPKKLSNNLYLETSYSTTACIKNARRLLDICGHKGQLLKI